MILLCKGAEADIYQEENVIIKKRLSKDYRIKEIDQKIIKARVKKEAKVIKKVNSLNIKSPLFIKTEGNSIYMQKIEGITVKQYLEENKEKNEIFKELGKIIRKLHDNQIIHGDLTTLNFLINKKKEIFIIDFGLSQFSSKAEDKAVDLYVFERALRCGHNTTETESFYEGYEDEKNKEIMKKLEEVRRRGRKRENK